jgi:hypothetical protein
MKKREFEITLEQWECVEIYLVQLHTRIRIYNIEHVSFWFLVAKLWPYVIEVEAETYVIRNEIYEEKARVYSFGL